MDCEPFTLQFSNVVSSGWKLKQMLGKWKEKQPKTPSPSSPECSEYDESTDQELKPVRLISDQTEVAARSQKPCDVDLSAVLADFQKHKLKVKIEINNFSETDAEAETEELKSRLQRENVEGHGKIQRLAPGISWLKKGEQMLDLSHLPMFDLDIGEIDRDVINLCKSALSVNRLTLNFTLYVQLVKNKHNLLNNMFIAMCLHSRIDSVKALHSCLHSLLSRSCHHLAELNSWSPSCAHILNAIKFLGASRYYAEDVIDEGNHSFQSVTPQSHNFAVKIKSFLSILTCSFKNRKSYTVDEVLKLTTAVTKLSLDKSLIRLELSPHFDSCVDALICLPSDETFAEVEHDLCANLLSIANHHHNKLHIVQTVPARSERCMELRMTLAFCAICQLLKEDTYDQLPLEWSMNSLAIKYLSLEVKESTDMYSLYSMISLFDIALGNKVDQMEKESLLVMKEKLSTECRLLKEHPMKPDITRTKCFMHRVELRWNWLAQDATPVEELLDIKDKMTPTKVIPVNSQEVRGGGEDEQGDDSSDETAQGSINTLAGCISQTGHKRALSIQDESPTKCNTTSPVLKDETPSSQPSDKRRGRISISQSGLQKLRDVMREAYNNSSASSSNSSTPFSSTPVKGVQGLSAFGEANTSSPCCAAHSSHKGSPSSQGDSREEASHSQVKVEAMEIEQGEISSSDVDMEESLPDLD